MNGWYLSLANVQACREQGAGAPGHSGDPCARADRTFMVATVFSQVSQSCTVIMCLVERLGAIKQGAELCKDSAGLVAGLHAQQS